MDDGRYDENGLDRADRVILRELAADGRISMTELARRAGLSKTPVLARVKRLEKAGFIQGYGARLNWAKLGQGRVTFVEVRLTDTREPALKAFRDAALAAPAIVECHMIAGAFDYLLKVRTRDIDEYRRVMGEVVSAMPHVSSTSTHVVMEQVKDEIGPHGPE